MVAGPGPTVISGHVGSRAKHTSMAKKMEEHQAYPRCVCLLVSRPETRGPGVRGLDMDTISTKGNAKQRMDTVSRMGTAPVNSKSPPPPLYVNRQNNQCCQLYFLKKKHGLTLLPRLALTP